MSGHDDLISWEKYFVDTQSRNVSSDEITIRDDQSSPQSDWSYCRFEISWKHGHIIADIGFILTKLRSESIDGRLEIENVESRGSGISISIIHCNGNSNPCTPGRTTGDLGESVMFEV